MTQDCDRSLVRWLSLEVSVVSATVRLLSPDCELHDKPENHVRVESIGCRAASVAPVIVFPNNPLAECLRNGVVATLESNSCRTSENYGRQQNVGQQRHTLAAKRSSVSPSVY